mmetsp:Transcript_15145/g.18256  ORF Transcript_15145/g.18256 Transcript_15145/m.18256 type:complete len:121 (+) Transcript_15145:51-413(+)
MHLCNPYNLAGNNTHRAFSLHPPQTALLCCPSFILFLNFSEQNKHTWQMLQTTRPHGVSITPNSPYQHLIISSAPLLSTPPPSSEPHHHPAIHPLFTHVFIHYSSIPFIHSILPLKNWIQ